MPEKSLETTNQEKEKQMRTVHVQLTIDLTMKVDEGVEIGHVVDELDYNFADTTTQATVEDTEIIDYEVLDSR